MSKILLLITLIFGLIIGVYLTDKQTGFLSRADISIAPQEIKISNISDNAFTVTWLTVKETPGLVSFGENESLGNIVSDDRDQGSPKSRITHHVTLKNLEPATVYYYQINLAGKILTQTTAPITSDTPPLPEPLFGSVSAGNAPVSESMIYSKAGNSSLLSSYTRADGNFLITLNNARSADLKTYAKISDADKISLEVKSGESSLKKEITGKEKTSAVALILENNSLQSSDDKDLNNDGVINVVDYAMAIKRLIFR